LCLFLPHFYGEVSERRPWVFKREDRPKGVPNSSPRCPGGDSAAGTNLRNLTENSVRISGAKIVTRYNYRPRRQKSVGFEI